MRRARPGGTPGSAARAGVAIGLVMLCAPALAESRLAVLDFTGSAKVDPELLEALAERARHAAAQEAGRRLAVMDRENMNVILRDMGRTCADVEKGECEVERGRIIGAAVMMTGHARFIEATYVLDLKVYETASARLVDGRSVRARRQLELLDATEQAARALVRSALRGAAPAAVAAGEGEIGERAAATVAPAPEDPVVSFESTPAGAVVQVDGQLVCAATPCRKRVAAGAHEALFQKERHLAVAQQFMADAGAVVRATLAPTFARLSVETVPPGLGVTIDGIDAGRSPVAGREVEPGVHDVLVSDPCWLRAGERVSLRAAEARVVRLEARPRVAGLKVNAEDAAGDAVDARVRVDGADAGAAGATLQVPACSRRVEVALAGETFAAELRLEEGKVATITARPAARPVVPPAAPAPARMASTRAPSLAGMVRLPAGTVRFERADFAVAPFLLDVTEVTAGAYARCVEAGRCTAPGGAVWATYGVSGKSDHPVNYVDWAQARAYCDWAGKRLPTREEWLWAARGAEAGTLYPWGNAEPQPKHMCWNAVGSGKYLREGKRDGTCRVGSHPAGDTPQGVKDLQGGVSEWTSSGSPDGSRKAIVGMGWKIFGAVYYGGTPENATLRLYDLGFRCATSEGAGAP